MTTTKKSVFDFIENNNQTIFLYVSMKSIINEDNLKELLTAKESDIISGKLGIKRKVIHKSSSKIVFDDNSNLYKTDKITNSYTFKTNQLIWYIREIEIDMDNYIMHKFMCYATEFVN